MQHSAYRAQAAPAPPTPQTPPKARQNRARVVGPLLILLGLVVALLAVVLVPLLVGGTEPVSGRATRAAATSAPTASVACASLSEATAALGYTPAQPKALPAGYAAAAIQVLDDTVLEISYKNGKDTLYYRTGAGNEDLSGDAAEYAFTSIEEANGVARSYAGTSEQKLYTAVWTTGDQSFALSAPAGLPADELRALAESVA